MLYDILHLLQKGFLGLSMKPNWSENKIIYIIFKNTKAFCFPHKSNLQGSSLKYHPKFLFLFFFFKQSWNHINVSQKT